MSAGRDRPGVARPEPALGSPEISAIVVTDTVAAARPLFEALRAQDAHERMEVVVAAPAGTHEDVRVAAGDEFAGVRCVAADPRADGLALPRVLAIRAASAPVVVVTETHCFPQPGWAAALIDAHRGPAAAIGPVFANANPERLVSWAQFLCHYGPFAEPLPPGPYLDIPGHNSSYKRDVLLTLDAELPTLAATEYLLHRRLRAMGHELAMAPAARVRHVNVSRPGAALRESYFAGRLFAAARREGWTRRRRLLYALAFPALALVRLRRHAGDARRVAAPGGKLVLVPMLAGLVASAIGEAAGYVAGDGGAASQIIDLELRRDRYLAGDAPSERLLTEAIAA